MNEFVAIENLAPIFENERIIPTITLWNRLEGRPRTHDFDRALRAEVRDPLWMLTKQWQMGEFRVDDAGSPIVAKVRIDTTALTTYRPARGPAEAFPDDVPLEAAVEARPVPFTMAGTTMALDLRVSLGRAWLKLVGDLEPGLADKFVAALPFAMPDPDDRADAAVAAHRASWQTAAAFSGRAMDGHALLQHLAVPGNHASDLVTLADPAHAAAAAAEAAEAAFRDLYRRLYFEPTTGGSTAWLPERLEYAFVSAPVDTAAKRFVADGYSGGHLDWYDLDIAAHQDAAGLGPVPDEPADVETSHDAAFLPVPLQFDGMPNTRWWTFEQAARTSATSIPTPPMSPGSCSWSSASSTRTTGSSCRSPCRAAASPA